MPKYKFVVEQVNEYHVFIEAESENEAIMFFDEDYTVEEFGEPKFSKIDWEVFAC